MIGNTFHNTLSLQDAYIISERSQCRSRPVVQVRAPCSRRNLSVISTIGEAHDGTAACQAPGLIHHAADWESRGFQLPLAHVRDLMETQSN